MFAASRRYFCFGYSDCKGGFHSTRLHYTTHMRTHVNPQTIRVCSNVTQSRDTSTSVSYYKFIPTTISRLWRLFLFDPQEIIIHHQFYILDEDIFTLTWVASVQGVLVEAGSIVIEGSNIVAVTNCKYCKDCKYQADCCKDIVSITGPLRSGRPTTGY